MLENQYLFDKEVKKRDLVIFYIKREFRFKNDTIEDKINCNS